MNRLLVPLAQAYLSSASEEVQAEPISHTDPAIVDPAVVQSLQDAVGKMPRPGLLQHPAGPGDYCSTRAPSRRSYTTCSTSCCSIYCQRIVDLETDVVLLAGLPSKLSTSKSSWRCTCRCPLADHSHAQPLRRATGIHTRTKRGVTGVIVDPKSPAVGGRGHRIDGPQRHAAAIQIRDAFARSREQPLLGRHDRRHLGIRQERILFVRRGPGPRGNHRVLPARSG